MGTKSADKRSVSTDALETLGTAPLGDNEARDAIHLAVEPVIAGEKLFAGQDVGFQQGASGLVATTNAVKKLGIVDPFLKEPVYPGQRFWLVVYPRQIKSLRHVWEHPDFPEALSAPEAVSVVEVKAPYKPSPEELIIAAIEDSRKWIEDYADDLGVDYDWLIDNLTMYQLGEWHYAVHPEDSGRWEGEYLNQDVWPHWERVTGRTAKKEGSFFTCSC